MDKEEITKALSFYQIKDKDYYNKCMECIENLEQNKNLKDKVMEIRKKMLEDDLYLKSLWNYQDLEEIVKENTLSFLTNIILLSTFPVLKSNPRNLSNKYLKIAKKRIRESLLNDIVKRGYDSIRISQMLWGIYFVKERIFEIGRLQYELCFINPLTNKEEKGIKIHIPRGESLKDEEVIESLKKAPKEIKKYFKLDNPNYYCSSWLLSKEILSMLKNNANIVRFSKHFVITEGEECTEDILNFIFELTECRDYKELPEDTSLEKKVKEHLLKGETFHLGIGLLKK